MLIERDGCYADTNMVITLMPAWHWWTPFGYPLSEYFRCWFSYYFIPVYRSDVPDSPCVCPSLAGGYFPRNPNTIYITINNDFSKKPSITV